MIEVSLFGIVLGLIPITLAGLFVTAYLQYRRGDQLDFWLINISFFWLTSFLLSYAGGLIQIAAQLFANSGILTQSNKQEWHHAL